MDPGFLMFRGGDGMSDALTLDRDRDGGSTPNLKAGFALCRYI